MVFCCRLGWLDLSCRCAIGSDSSQAIKRSKFLNCLTFAAVTLLNTIVLANTASAQSAPADDCSQKPYLECLDCCDKQYQSCLDEAAKKWNDANAKYRQCLTSAIRQRNQGNATCTTKKTTCESNAAQFQQTNPPEYQRLMAECAANEASCRADVQSAYNTQHQQCAADLGSARDQYEKDKADCANKHIACSLGCKPPVRQSGGARPLTPQEEPGLGELTVEDPILEALIDEFLQN